jgi:ribulose-5-phosphate 4-epimerase/fuculose-1-phosphate aldolase
MVNRPVSIPAARRGTHAGAESVREAYRELRAMGWSEGEAGNLTAHLAGLEVTRKGWRIHEVEALLFIRSLVATGRLDP